MLSEIFVEIVDSKGRLRVVPPIEALAIACAQAFAEDTALGIKRNHIPFNFTIFPDTPKTPDFYKLAHAIRSVATFDLAPDNKDQGLWMRCVQLYWQAKAILLANKIFELIPDPAQPGCSLSRILTSQGLENLQLETDAEKAFYDLLKEGESHIRSWASAKGIDYPFLNFQELFIYILEARFKRDWQEEAFSPVSSCSNKKLRRKEYRHWLKFFADQFNGDPLEEKYCQRLMDMGWEGYPLLALRSKKNDEPFNELWKAYLQTHRTLVKLIDSDLCWKNSIPHQNKKTSQKKPIRGVLTDDGYIDWVWR